MTITFKVTGANQAELEARADATLEKFSSGVQTWRVTITAHPVAYRETGEVYAWTGEVEATTAVPGERFA